MSTFGEHCQQSITVFGKPYEEVHTWLDEFFARDTRLWDSKIYQAGIAVIKITNCPRSLFDRAYYADI